MKTTSELLTKHISNQLTKDSSIQYVKDYLSTRDDIQVTSKPETYNSSVSPGSKFEYDIDIMDMESNGATSNTRYGLVSIDNFTKIAEVARIKDRTPEAMIDGLKKMFTSMGKPKQLYSDEESSMRSTKLNIFLRDNEIKSVQTTTHAYTVERFIRPCKDNLYRRLDSLNEDKTEWVTQTYNII